MILLIVAWLLEVAHVQWLSGNPQTACLAPAKRANSSIVLNHTDFEVIKRGSRIRNRDQYFERGNKNALTEIFRTSKQQEKHLKPVKTQKDRILSNYSSFVGDARK